MVIELFGQQIVSSNDKARYTLLNSLKRPVLEDPTQKWIGSYNGRQMINCCEASQIYYLNKMSTDLVR